jgi:hypothetical protein
MSYEATIAAAGGDEATMAKSFVIIAHDFIESWYANLCPGSIKSLGDLHKKNYAQTSRASTSPLTTQWTSSAASKGKEIRFKNTGRGSFS